MITVGVATVDRQSAGQFLLVCPGAFPNGKSPSVGGFTDVAAGHLFYAIRRDDDSYTIVSCDSDDERTPTDGFFQNTPIVIEVAP